MPNFEGKLWMPCCKTIVDGFSTSESSCIRKCPECGRQFVFEKDRSRRVINAREV